MCQMSLRERGQTSWADLAQLDLSTGRGESRLRRLEVRPGPGSTREAHQRQRRCWEAHRRRAMTPLRLSAALEFLRAYSAYPVSTEAVREAERLSQLHGGPDALVLPMITRLAATQAVIGWLWPHLRTMEGGLLLCRVIRQYVLHDIDLRELSEGLYMTAEEADAGAELQGRRACTGSSALVPDTVTALQDWCDRSAPLGMAPSSPTSELYDGQDVRSGLDCDSCRWPQIVHSFKGCRCRSGIAPSHLWDAGVLEMGTAASLLAWEAHRDEETDGALAQGGPEDSRFGMPVVRHAQGYDYTAIGIWSSGTLLTAQLRLMDTTDWQGDVRLWANGRLRVRALGDRASAVRCVIGSCSAPATSTCRHTPKRCEARRCGAGCTEGSTGEGTDCTCEGAAAESQYEVGWPVDIEVQSSEWGPGSRAARLGAVRHWTEAVDGGCCSLPDGWGTDRLPAHMERVVRLWEDTEGHGQYVDRRRGVLVRSGPGQHTHGGLMQTGTVESTVAAQDGISHGDALESAADVGCNEMPEGIDNVELG